MAALASASSSSAAASAVTENESASLIEEYRGKRFHKRWGEIMGKSNEETEERKKMLAELWDDMVQWGGKERVEEALSLCTCHAETERIVSLYKTHVQYLPAQGTIRWRSFGAS